MVPPSPVTHYNVWTNKRKNNKRWTLMFNTEYSSVTTIEWIWMIFDLRIYGLFHQGFETFGNSQRYFSFFHFLLSWSSSLKMGLIRRTYAYFTPQLLHRHCDCFTSCHHYLKSCTGWRVLESLSYFVRPL